MKNKKTVPADELPALKDQALMFGKTIAGFRMAADTLDYLDSEFLDQIPGLSSQEVQRLRETLWSWEQLAWTAYENFLRSQK